MEVAEGESNASIETSKKCSFDQVFLRPIPRVKAEFVMWCIIVLVSRVVAEPCIFANH